MLIRSVCNQRKSFHEAAIDSISARIPLAFQGWTCRDRSDGWEETSTLLQNWWNFDASDALQSFYVFAHPIGAVRKVVKNWFSRSTAWMCSLVMSILVFAGFLGHTVPCYVHDPQCSLPINFVIWNLTKISAWKAVIDSCNLWLFLLLRFTFSIIRVERYSWSF